VRRSSAVATASARRGSCGARAVCSCVRGSAVLPMRAAADKAERQAQALGNCAVTRRAASELCGYDL